MYSDILWKKINFIYPADKTFRIIRIIDFKRAEPTCYRTNFHYAISGEQNGEFWYILLRIMLLTYSQAMTRFSNCGGVCRMIWTYYVFFSFGSTNEYKCQGICERPVTTLERIFHDYVDRDIKGNIIHQSRELCFVIGPRVRYSPCS